MMRRLVLASGNLDKFSELRNLLLETDVELVSQHVLGVDAIEETGASFVENALLKARHAARMTGMSALADDSGLCVPFLGGAPGLYSARYAGIHGDHVANNDKLLGELKAVPASQRGAFFICVLVLLAHADDPAPVLAEGRWYGTILTAPRGNRGFGYDPLFVPVDYSLSAAELDPALKNRLSHRSQAWALLHARLNHTG